MDFMNERDLIALLHVRDYAHEIHGFIQGENRVSLDTDVLLRRALCGAFVYVGNAAQSVSDELRAANSQISWSELIALRNHIVHEYDTINLDWLWDTATEAIPPLIVELEKLIPLENIESNDK